VRSIKDIVEIKFDRWDGVMFNKIKYFPKIIEF
jgi:hypothetical protein